LSSELTCLITSVPIDGESIEVEFSCEEDHLQKNVAFVLAQVNNRLREVNLIITEDMGVKQSLTVEQYGHLMNILSVQFPYKNPELPQYLAKSTRVLVRKMSNHKEQIALRAAGDMSGSELQKNLVNFLDMTTARTIETNLNDKGAYDYHKSLETADQIPIQMILDVLYGRTEPNVVANRLSAQKEEREAKEEGYL
jgi:hypothetical protein